MVQRFLIVGGIGFVVDAGLTWLLIRSGLHPMLARPPATLVAMALTWLLNRRFTFQTRRSATSGEFMRYAGVAAVTYLFNQAVFALLVTMQTHPVVAVAVASLAQALLSYLGYRHILGNPKAAGDGGSAVGERP